MEEENITLEEFSRVVKWFEYSDRMKKVIKQPLIKSLTKEYYFFDSNWIEEFKKAYNYNELKIKFRECKDNIKKNTDNKSIDFTPEQIYFLYKQYCDFRIPKTTKEKLKRIKNDNIIQQKLMLNIKYLNPKKENFTINNYYNNFVLLDQDIFKEFYNVGYYISAQIKFDINIGDGIFIIELQDNCIEVGVFDSVYKFKTIFLFIFSDKEEEKIEIDKIKKNNLIQYLNYYNINTSNLQEIQSQIIRKNEKEIILINLINYNRIKTYQTNKLSSSSEKRRGFTLSDQKCSRMNSIIQILTSIKEIKDYLMSKENIIKEYNHIYILSSTFLKLYNYLYNENIDKEEYKEIEKLKIILNFIDPENDKKSLDQYILFILDILHDELNESEKKKTNQISLLSFDSPFNTENESLNIFSNYYNEYFKSKISELFHFIRKKYIICHQCKESSFYSFQAFPFLIFDLKKVYDFIILQHTEYKQIISAYKNNPDVLNKKIENYLKKKELQPIHISNCFEYYLKSKEFLEYTCKICNANTRYDSNYLIYKSPIYFIIILYREPESTVNLLFDEELNLETYVEKTSNFKKYELIGVLNYFKKNNEDKYYTILRNSESEKKWIKFDDVQMKDVDEKEIFTQTQSTVLLIYKAIQY